MLDLMSNLQPYVEPSFFWEGCFNIHFKQIQILNSMLIEYLLVLVCVQNVFFPKVEFISMLKLKNEQKISILLTLVC